MSASLNLVVLRCSDIDRSAALFSSMGLKFSKHAHGSGPEHYSYEQAGVVFELYAATANFPVTRGARVGFLVDNVDALTSLLTQRGAEVVNQPSDSSWGRRSVLRDSDGHSIELTSKP
jgi:catechol 2,3-dioxygenase-like lactoylglutathione lyase family enzyme